MAKSLLSSCKGETGKEGLTDKAMATVSLLLMQLFGEEEDDNANAAAAATTTSSSVNEKNECRSGRTSEKNKEEEVDHNNKVMIKPKKRRYRSIDNLYMTTKPMDFMHAKKIKL